ncbi:ABC transporter ATP-binding protein [Brevibacillus fluminis]|uniref:ABC transporter ATP-binding protein n=1 Tax=Brevibacillus fluminis TaxID=511487 RepID=UPI003F8A715B
MADLLEMKNIHKTYPNGTKANQGVNLTIREGEIHALVGENGAGKSTLMKILFGLEQPTEGELRYKGQPVTFHNPKDAIAHGIGMVHQHFMLVPSFTVAENIVLGIEKRRGPLSLFTDRKAAVKSVQQLSESYGLRVQPEARVETISVGQKQRVEILKALYRGARLLILDEPTAVLTPQETDELFVALRQLVTQGYTIIFITHKLREVMEISDRVTVLRAGKTIGTLATKETSKEEISRLMVGRDVLLRVEKKAANPQDVVLAVENLSVADNRGSIAVKQLSFSVRSGEIFGIAGVEGNGQTELVEAITGLRARVGGSVRFLQQELTGLDVLGIRNLGIGHIPEDRQSRGACLTASIQENLILDLYRQKAFNRGGLLHQSSLKQKVDELIAHYDIRTKSGDFLAGSLSGGNLQKVVIARELSKDPKLLVAAQPTRGVDIGAIEFIHREIIRKRDEGTAVLLISAELSEVMSLSDRIGVMYNGELVAILENNHALTEEEIGFYMLGVKKHEKKAMGS